MEPKIIFVTGGTGLLGSHLIVRLLRDGHQVVALKRSESRISLVEKVAAWYFPEEKISFHRLEWREGDIENLASLMEVMEGCEIVYHCAAVVSFVPKKKYNMITANVHGTANVVDAAMNLGIKRLCHVSSISALGSGMDEELIDEHTTRNPNAKYSGYSISKLYSELEVWRGVNQGLESVIVNPAIILGPGDWNQGSARFIQTVDRGMPVYTSGFGSYVDVRDVVDVMIRLTDSEISGERYCLSAYSLPYRDFFTALSQRLGKKAPSFPVKEWHLKIAAGVFSLISLITGKDPVITRETASSAFNRKQYSSAKIIDTLNYQFRSFEDTLSYCVDAYQKEKKQQS
jgi:dihydroflavonol-4-reductase